MSPFLNPLYSSSKSDGGVFLLAEKSLLEIARWPAFMSSVAEIQMVPADVVGCRRFVRDVAATVNGVRVVTVCGLRAVVVFWRPQWSNLAREFVYGLQGPGRGIGRWFPVAHFLMRELCRALYVRNWEMAHQLFFQPIVRNVIRWWRYDVFNLGCLLLVQLRHHVVVFGSLARDACQFELRLCLYEPDGWSVWPEGLQAYSEFMNRWARSLVIWLRLARSFIWLCLSRSLVIWFRLARSFFLSIRQAVK